MIGTTIETKMGSDKDRDKDRDKDGKSTLKAAKFFEVIDNISCSSGGVRVVLGVFCAEESVSLKTDTSMDYGVIRPEQQPIPAFVSRSLPFKPGGAHFRDRQQGVCVTREV